MMSFAALVQQGNSWLFLPSAVVLGALHGLEPGHSKTMMAAFIIAVRGTLMQAVMLGLAATVSHTAIVWIIGLGGLYFGRNWGVTREPYFQLASAVLIVAVAVWMIWRTWRAQTAFARTLEHPLHHPHHDHAHDPDHVHEAERYVDTGRGTLRLALTGGHGAAHFTLQAEEGPLPGADAVQLATERADGSREVFTLRREGNELISAQYVPEPHEFVVRLRLGTDDYDVEFVAHAHRHAIEDYEGLDVSAPGYQDPHELAHANDIRRRFGNRNVTTAQIVTFGVTAGLLPCPAAITVLLLCLQLKKFALGATLVLGFSIGLALTMVASGAVAALGVRHLSRHFGTAFSAFARRAPYFSGALILLVGLYLGYQGWRGLA